MYNFGLAILDFFLPLHCAACGKTIASGAGFVCPICLDNLKRLPPEILTIEFNKKFAEAGYVTGYWAPYMFFQSTGIQNIVHQFKYNKKFRVAQSMGVLIGNLFKREAVSFPADNIIPVPLFRTKKAQRGYNQSEYIAGGLHEALGIPILSSALKRIRNTRTQTGLDIEKRKENMEGAFKIRNIKAISGKNIILVDDVVTTGATINECAKMLKEAGAGYIFVISFALTGLGR
jgi:ComF family protein